MIAASRAWLGVVVGGVAAGVLDILAAFVQTLLRGGSPAAVLKAVASGVLGRPAFQGGAAVAALGLFLHFVIATGWALVYFAASRFLPVLVRRPVVCGALYGVLVCWLMQNVVVPLSAAPAFGRSAGAMRLVPYGIHIFFVGLPIALAVARFTRPDDAASRR